MTEEGAPILRMIDEVVREVIGNKDKVLEDFARAYIAETGLMPSEIEMVQQDRGREFVWFFRRKGSK